jgi:hypothetical protein
MTEAGALWADEGTFESALAVQICPAEPSRHKKASRGNERLMLSKMVPKGRFELPTKGL